MSRRQRPTDKFEPRPFASQTKVSFDIPSTIVYEKKFDTAIRGSHIEQHYSRIRQGNDTLDDRLTSSLPNYPINQQSHDVSCATHARIMLDLYNKHEMDDSMKLHNKDVPARTQRMINLAFDNLELQTYYLNHKNQLPSKQRAFKELGTIRKLETEQLSYLNCLLDYSDWLMGVINASNTMYADYYRDLGEDDYIRDLSARNSAEYKPLSLMISWSHNYCVIRHQGYAVLLPKSYILLLHNKASDLISIVLYAKLARHSSMPRNFPTLILDTCLELWQTVVDYGQDGFTICKCLEALASAEALCAVEEWENTEFLRVVTKDLYNDTGYDYKTSSLRHIWRNQSPATMHELACLSKIAGHPLVDMEGGALAIHKYTTEQYELNYDKINECTCYVKQNYVRNYVLRYGKWPSHVITSAAAPDAIKYGSLTNSDPEGFAMKSKYGPIHISDYNYVELLPDQKFNKLENVIPHLKDKTISALRGHVIKKYINKQDMKISWNDTRLLLYYLLQSGEENDHVEFLEQYSNGELLDDFMDYLVIRIVPKEKEMKVKFRGFGCTTFPNRMLFLAQEKTAMEYLDLFCDEQAMTLSELDLVKRLFAFRCLKDAYPQHHVLYIMVDASKWNNHFRRETVDTVMSKTLDRVYDTKVFSRTHEKYRKTFFYVPDGDCTYYWEGQDGGVEGLNQDTWVVTYIAQIKTALSNYDLKYHVLCKGDDLRLAVMIPIRDERAVDMSATKQIIMTRLASVAKEMGHDIKILDSYGSTRYFNFSKSASIDRTELSQVLRKIQKCYGATNAFLPTIDDYIGSTFSNSHSACRVTTNVVPCFFVALAWSYHYLLTDTPTLDEIKLGRRRRPAVIDEEQDCPTIHYSALTDQQLVGLLIVPSACGGFPIIHLHNMMVRAESDLLPAFLDLVQYVLHLNKVEMAEFLKNFLYFDERKKVTWKPLYMDMYAMPILKPQTPSFILRSSMMDPLRQVANSGELMELFELIDDSEGSDKIIRCLDSCPVVPAKVFSVIYASLPEALLGEILRKFETARSVMELLILRKGRRYSLRVLKRLLVADIEVNRWRIARGLGYHSSFSTSAVRMLDPCPALTAAKMRAKYWGKPVEGITMPPMGHLIGFCTIAQAAHNPHVRSNHFTLQVDTPTEFLPHGHNNYHFGVGWRRPFLGHRTGTGTVNPLLHLVEKDKFLSNLRNLAELASWVQICKVSDTGELINSNIYHVIGKIIKLYTAEDLQTFAPFLGCRKSGTVAHHIRTRHFRESIVPNSLSNVYQYIEGESNTHTKFFGDHGHYWINFLQILCHAVGIATWELNVSPYFTTPQTVWIYTENCDHCMRLVDENPIVVDISLIEKVKFPQLQVLRMGSQAMAVLKESLSIAKTRKFNLEGNDVELTVAQATLGTLKMVIEMSIETSLRIIDRFTQHPGSKAGTRVLKAFAPKTKRRVVGQRELSCMDNDTLSGIVPFIIVQLMFKHLSRRTIGHVPDSLHSLPPVHLPWYSLIEELAKVGRLQKLSYGIANIANKYPSYLTFKPEQVAAYLGTVSLEAIGNIDVVPDLILLSDYEVTDIHRHLEDHLFIVSWVRFVEELRMAETVDERIDAVVHAVIRDYLICNTPLHTDDQDHMSVTGGYLVRDMYMMDEMDEELNELRNARSSDEIRRLLYSRHILFQRRGQVEEQEIIDMIEGDIDVFVANALEWMAETSINVISTTTLACLATLREKGVSFRDQAPDINAFDASIGRMDTVWAPSLPPMVYGVLVPTPSENPDVSSEVLVQPIIREHECLPDDAYLFRPYGVNNASADHLVLIFQYLGVGRGTDFSHLSVSMLGDGLGNGTRFFARFGYEMRIVFTTKPDNQMLHISPDAALEEITARRHILYNRHIQEGVWDLKDYHTYEELYRIYGRHDIFFCDAEPSPGEQEFEEVYYNICNHFVAARKEGALLIMQVAATNPYTIGQCLSFLAMHCSHTFIIQPQSISRPYTYYLVAYGHRRATPLYEARDVNITPRTATVVRSFMARMSGLRNDRRSAAHNRISFVSTMSRVHYYRHSLPPLWVSFMNKDLGVVIAWSQVQQLVSQSSGQGRYWEIPPITQLHTYDQQEYLIRGLRDPTEQSERLMAQPRFGLDFHANRIMRVQRYLLQAGFNWALTIYRSGTGDILEADYKTAFYQLYFSLPWRDKIIDPNDPNFFSSVTILPNGVRVSYWGHFYRGVCIVQMLAGWMHVIQQVNVVA